MDDACANPLTGGDLDSDNGGDHAGFIRRVRAHVRETGHEVCVTESREYILEPASSRGPRTVAEIEAVTAEIVARVVAERHAKGDAAG